MEINLVPQSVEIIDLGAENEISILKKIEKCGRTCYKSEDKITDDSCIRFVRGLLSSRHESVIEHHNVSVKFITNRGVTHEIVRHRLNAFSQSSTRYCRYNDSNMEFIYPEWWDRSDQKQKLLFIDACKASSMFYTKLLDSGWRPEQAREVLNNALKTELVMTTNLRNWRHVLRQRLDKRCHPQMRDLMTILMHQFMLFLPEFFRDIYNDFYTDFISSGEWKAYE